MKRSRGLVFGLIGIVSLSFWLGTQFQQFIYDDICLDMGGGKNPGNYPICVVTAPSSTAHSP